MSDRDNGNVEEAEWEIIEPDGDVVDLISDGQKVDYRKELRGTMAGRLLEKDINEKRVDKTEGVPEPSMWFRVRRFFRRLFR